MLSMVSENIANGNAIQPQDHQDRTLKDTPFSPLDGQSSSLLSLTLNEIQLKRGKSFGSMNMDEFLTNLWNSDDTQVPSQPKQNVRPANDHGGATNQHPNLARQGSFSIPSPLCQKTVDEVWFEIQNEEPQQHNSNNFGDDHEPPQRQPTLGEITLEDFLVKAGVVQEGPAGSSQQKKVTPIQDRNNTCLDMNFGIRRMMELGYQNVGNNLSAGNGFAAYQMFPQGKGYNVGEVVRDNAKNEKCQSIMELGEQSNKKRVIDGLPGVVVERRQRRMIKNRESAARSRARKQAYTVELELELNQLKEENAKLKQIMEEIEEKRKEEVSRRKSSKMTQKKAEKLRSIRRTASLAW